MEKLNDLVELANKATSGKWIADSGEGWDAIISQQDMVNGNFIVGDFIGPDSKANKDFVLAASPENILAIAEAFRELEQRAEAAEAKLVPDGWQLVPEEPTERMVIAGFESEPNEDFSKKDMWEAFKFMSGCQQAEYKARLCWAAMLAAAPNPSE